MNRIKVEIEYRDDTKETFDCVDFPAIGDWITLYLAKDNQERMVIPKESIKNIRYYFADRRKEDE